MTIDARAKEALQYFEEKTANDRVTYVLRTDAPVWVVDMCRQAHSEMLPNDAIFEAIYDILSMIASECEQDDLDDLREYLEEHLDYLVVDNHRVLRWFTECYPLSAEYVDHYKCESGGGSVMDEIAGGFYMHLLDISEVILLHLTKPEACCGPQH